jgi:F-type H+-transporting ATPase subunit c
MRNFGKLLVFTLLATVIPMAASAQAAGEHATNWGAALGAGIAIGLAALGCGIGQGLTAGNTTAGIARNPGAAGAMNTPFILGMALIESIALVGFVTAFLLIGKI